MKAVVTTGQGSLDVLDYRDVPVPSPGPARYCCRCSPPASTPPTSTRASAGTRRAVTGDTTSAAAAGEEAAATVGERRMANERRAAHADDAGGSRGRSDAGAGGGWSAPTPFPLIQGTDCCGRVVAVGRGGDEGLIGRRALVRPCMRPLGFGSMESIWMGSDFDGAFAQFVKAPASEVFAVETELSDAELGAIPCSCGTAENMLAAGRRRRRAARGGRPAPPAASARPRCSSPAGAARSSRRSRRARRPRQVLALGADRVVATRGRHRREPRRAGRGRGRRQRLRAGSRRSPEGAEERRDVRLVGGDRRPASSRSTSAPSTSTTWP